MQISQVSIATHSGAAVTTAAAITAVQWQRTSAVVQALQPLASTSAMRERGSVWLEALCGDLCCN
jgi:hypothetical protein